MDCEFLPFPHVNLLACLGAIFSGTSVLILVGSATDTARKVQAELVSQKYRTIELDDFEGPPR